MKLLTMLLMVFELVACSAPAPDTDVCVVNALQSRMKCYNLARDYDDDGNIKPTASPTYKPCQNCEAVDKHIVTDSIGFQNLKAFANQINYRLNQCESGQ